MNLVLKTPYLMSMYTETAFRRKGIAKSIVCNAIAWSREHGYDKINLHASEMGRHLYESLGFSATTEMRLRL
jgi:GNAT superfamily N-acetyltransferase